MENSPILQTDFRTVPRGAKFPHGVVTDKHGETTANQQPDLVSLKCLFPSNLPLSLLPLSSSHHVQRLH